MSIDLSIFTEALDDSPFEERPVTWKEFVYGRDWMNSPQQSPVQEDTIDRLVSIYNHKELVLLYGKEEADRQMSRRARDNLLILGKGSGKNSQSQIIFLYVIYQLLCLKDPAKYFGKFSGDNIDIVSMALNARSAVATFLNTFKQRLERIKWFAGKYDAHVSDVRFAKNITMYALNSEHSSAEGYNLFFYLQDEPSGDTLERAMEMYKALSATVASRFPNSGRGVALSFPRSASCFMMTRWKEAVVESTKEMKSHTFKLDDRLPDGIKDNEFTIDYYIEQPISYKYDNFFAVKLPTWEVNPTTSIDDFKKEFYDDPEDALMRFAAIPPEGGENAFFKNHSKVDEAFSQANGWQGDIVCHPKDDTAYYLHLDLSQVADRTACAMGHVEKWVQVDMGSIQTDPKPHITIDLVRVWEPTKSNPVNHGEVMDFVLELCKKFNIQKVTFDQWHSHDHIRHLQELGIDAEKKSLARPEYQEFLMAVSEQRIDGPNDPRLIDELKHLVILPTGKIDHPSRHNNDISEAVCGVIRNCVENEANYGSGIEIIDLKTLAQRQHQEELQAERRGGKIPDDINAWLDNLKSL